MHTSIKLAAGFQRDGTQIQRYDNKMHECYSKVVALDWSLWVNRCEFVAGWLLWDASCGSVTVSRLLWVGRCWSVALGRPLWVGYC